MNAPEKLKGADLVALAYEKTEFAKFFGMEDATDKSEWKDPEVADAFRTWMGRAALATFPQAPSDEAVREAFRDYDKQSGGVRHQTPWQIWRDAVAWAALAPVQATGAPEPAAWAARDWMRSITETELALIPNTGKDEGRRDRCRLLYPIPLYATPLASPAVQQEAEDAARYRVLRNKRHGFEAVKLRAKPGKRWRGWGDEGEILTGEELDAAIDAARAASSGRLG